MNAQDLLRARRDNNMDTIANAMVGYDSILYSYDAQNRKASELHMYWNASSSHWDTSANTIFVYHPTYGVIGYSINFRYNAGLWDTTGEDVYRYNIDTTLDYHVNYYNLGSGFIPYFREDDYYNSHKQITIYTRKEWNSVTNTFDNSVETVNHYNSAFQNDTTRQYTWNGSAYVNSKLTINVYNAQGLVATETGYTWVGGAWANGTRYVNTYNSAGKQTENTLYITQAGNFVAVLKYEYTYLNNIYLQEQDEQLFNTTTSIWYDAHKTIYLLNSSNQTTEKLDSEFDFTSSNMYLSGRMTLDYDADGNNSHYLISGYVPHLGALRNTTEQFNWYYLSATAIQEPAFNVQLNVYPNPSNGEFTISFTNETTGLLNVAMYDANGRLVKTIANRYEAPGAVQLNAEAQSMSAGIYFLQIKMGEHSIVRKIQIQ